MEDFGHPVANKWGVLFLSRALLRKLQEELKAGQLVESSEPVELKMAMHEFIKRKLQEGISYPYCPDLFE